MGRSVNQAALLFLAAFLLVAAPAGAQPPQARKQAPKDQAVGRLLVPHIRGLGRMQAHPHVAIDDEEIDADAIHLWQRWKELQDKVSARKELKQLHEDLIKNPEKFINDPRSREKLEMLLNNSGLTLDPNDPRVEHLKRWLERSGRNKTRPPSTDVNEELKKWLEETLRKTEGAEPQPIDVPPLPEPTPPPEMPDANHPPTPAPKLDESEMEMRRRMLDWIAEQSKRLDESKFRDSDLVRQIRNDLHRFTAGSGLRDVPHWGQNNPIGKRFADMARDLRTNQQWPRNLDVSLPKFNFSSSAVPTLPRLGGWGRAPSIGGIPGLGTPSLPPARVPSGDGLLVMVVLAVLAIVAWRIWKVLGGRRPQGADGGVIDLPWPSAPGAVVSRADLIRAFEYLAFVRLGEESKTWNHLELAAALGGEQPETRQAAGTLAALYEQARYAPGEEPLPTEALANARRSLSLLAGGAIG
jgi:hypothetical protein